MTSSSDLLSSVKEGNPTISLDEIDNLSTFVTDYSISFQSDCINACIAGLCLARDGSAVSSESLDKICKLLLVVLAEGLVAAEALNAESLASIASVTLRDTLSPVARIALLRIGALGSVVAAVSLPERFITFAIDILSEFAEAPALSPSTTTDSNAHTLPIAAAALTCLAVGSKLPSAKLPLYQPAIAPVLKAFGTVGGSSSTNSVLPSLREAIQGAAALIGHIARVRGSVRDLLCVPALRVLMTSMLVPTNDDVDIFKVPSLPSQWPNSLPKFDGRLLSSRTMALLLNHCENDPVIAEVAYASLAEDAEGSAKLIEEVLAAISGEGLGGAVPEASLSLSFGGGGILSTEETAGAVSTALIRLLETILDAIGDDATQAVLSRRGVRALVENATRLTLVQLRWYTMNTLRPFLFEDESVQQFIDGGVCELIVSAFKDAAASALVPGASVTGISAQGVAIRMSQMAEELAGFSATLAEQFRQSQVLPSFARFLSAWSKSEADASSMRRRSIAREAVGDAQDAGVTDVASIQSRFLNLVEKCSGIRSAFGVNLSLLVNSESANVANTMQLFLQPNVASMVVTLADGGLEKAANLLGAVVIHAWMQEGTTVAQRLGTLFEVDGDRLEQALDELRGGSPGMRCGLAPALATVAIPSPGSCATALEALIEDYQAAVGQASFGHDPEAAFLRSIVSASIAYIIVHAENLKTTLLALDQLQPHYHAAQLKDILTVPPDIELPALLRKMLDDALQRLENPDAPAVAVPPSAGDTPPPTADRSPSSSTSKKSRQNSPTSSAKSRKSSRSQSRASSEVSSRSPSNARLSPSSPTSKSVNIADGVDDNQINSGLAALRRRLSVAGLVPSREPSESSGSTSSSSDSSTSAPSPPSPPKREPLLIESPSLEHLRVVPSMPAEPEISMSVTSMRHLARSLYDAKDDESARKELLDAAISALTPQRRSQSPGFASPSHSYSPAAFAHPTEVYSPEDVTSTADPASGRIVKSIDRADVLFRAKRRARNRLRAHVVACDLERQDVSMATMKQEMSDLIGEFLVLKGTMAGASDVSFDVSALTDAALAMSPHLALSTPADGVHRNRYVRSDAPPTALSDLEHFSSRDFRVPQTPAPTQAESPRLSSASKLGHRTSPVVVSPTPLISHPTSPSPPTPIVLPCPTCEERLSEVERLGKQVQLLTKALQASEDRCIAAVAREETAEQSLKSHLDSQATLEAQLKLKEVSIATIEKDIAERLEAVREREKQIRCPVLVDRASSPINEKTKDPSLLAGPLLSAVDAGAMMCDFAAREANLARREEAVRNILRDVEVKLHEAQSLARAAQAQRTARASTDVSRAKVTQAVSAAGASHQSVKDTDISRVLSDLATLSTISDDSRIGDKSAAMLHRFVASAAPGLGSQSAPPAIQNPALAGVAPYLANVVSKEVSWPSMMANVELLLRSPLTACLSGALSFPSQRAVVEWWTAAFPASVSVCSAVVRQRREYLGDAMNLVAEIAQRNPSLQEAFVSASVLSNRPMTRSSLSKASSRTSPRRKHSRISRRAAAEPAPVNKAV